MSEREASMIAHAISEGLRQISNMSMHANRCEHYWGEVILNEEIKISTYTQECIHCKKVRRV